jgi:hypothetical protein
VLYVSDSACNTGMRVTSLILFLVLLSTAAAGECGQERSAGRGLVRQTGGNIPPAESLPSVSGEAGVPSFGRMQEGTVSTPSDEELDRRNRMLTGPRLPAGPVLDKAGRGAGPSVPMPPVTDPGER